MNCFKHNTVPAIGICKSCYKGLCSECARDVGQGLACEGLCENGAAELDEMNERGKKIYGIGKYNTRIPSSGVLMWGAVSIALWILVAVLFYTTGRFSWDVAAPAIFVSIISAFAVYSARRTGLKC